MNPLPDPNVVFPGPQPPEHASRRGIEARKLADLLGAERNVLLLSSMGGGKTWFVRAALIPKMRARQFYVRAIVRLNRAVPPGVNRYVFSALSSLEAAYSKATRLPESVLTGLTLQDYLTWRPKPADFKHEVFVFDQLEEILTLDSTDHDTKRVFFEQVGQLLETPACYVLFVLREDCLKAIQPYGAMLPNHLKAQFRLDLQGEKATLNPRPNPYVGPRSFLPHERLYGRSTETRKLVNLLSAERVVLLHSPSGAGKTSLIQAALVPAMRARKFHVRPSVRVNLEAPPGVNRYLFSTLTALESAYPEAEQLPEAALGGLTLFGYLQLRPRPAEAHYELLIFDQFEEVLTLDPLDRAAKHAFFEQLGHLLEDRTLWALFAIREDYLGALTPYVLPLPNRLNVTFRLDLLGVDAARRALQKPAENMGVAFADAAADTLVDDLRQVLVQTPSGQMEPQLGLYVEPVQLQVVAYRLWQSLTVNELLIDHDDLQDLGSVNQSLADYYATSVASVAEQIGAKERRIREWFDRKLITPEGIRGQVLMGAENSDGLPNRVVRLLEDAHLIRGERRAGKTWYELAHDRLLQPVRENNAVWFEQHLRLFQQQAVLWSQQGHSDGLLLRGKEFQRANKEANAVQLTGDESAYLQACRTLHAREQRDRRQRQLTVAGFAVSLLLLFFATANVFQANQRADEAKATRNAAQTSEAIADQQRNRLEQEVTKQIGQVTAIAATVTQVAQEAATATQIVQETASAATATQVAQETAIAEYIAQQTAIAAQIAQQTAIAAHAAQQTAIVAQQAAIAAQQTAIAAHAAIIGVEIEPSTTPFPP